jgi:transposase
MRFSLTPDEKSRLEAIVASAETVAKARMRAKILLMYADKRYSPLDIAAECGCTVTTVYNIVNRFKTDGLVPKDNGVPAALNHNYRKAPPRLVNADVEQRILALSRTRSWTLRQLADAAVETGIVPGISLETVGRILRRNATQMEAT